MAEHFDDLTKALASGMSRRDALRRFVGGLFGGVLAAVGLGKTAGAQAAHTCPAYCRSLGINPGGGNAFGKCVSNCAKCREGGGTACGASGCCHGTEACTPETSTCAEPVASCDSCDNSVVCDDLFSCGAGGSCGCFNNADQTACVCVDIGDGLCTSFPTVCDSDSDCPSGQLCFVSCCRDFGFGNPGLCAPACGTVAPTSSIAGGDGPKVYKN